MSEAAAKAYALFQADVGNDEGTGEWFQITQDQIDQFADVTHDHQFIHVDPEAAKATPFGTTIAHGFLTLSMLSHLAAGASASPPDPACAGTPGSPTRCPWWTCATTWAGPVPPR